MPSIVFLGTSAATPTKTRNVSSYALRFDDGRSFMVDCGEGTQHQLVRCSDLKSGKIDVVFITHLHGDHLFGIVGLLASLSLFGRDQPVKIVGPKGIKEYLESSLRISVTYLTYPTEIIELEEGKVANLGNISGVDVTAFPLKHKVTCFGYLVEEPEKKGKFDAQRAKSLGVTNGKDLGMLAAGKDITLADGTILRGSEFIGETRKGKKILMLGDTADSSSTIEASTGCDVVVHETTYDASLEQKAVEGGHSTSSMAGRFAKQIAAKKLIITHFSMRYHGDEAITVDDLLKETQLECPETIVLAAEDLKRYEI